MAKYIPDDFVERVRQSTDIASLVRESVPLKRAGSAFKGLCPFHREKTPSFMVNPERQIFKCFGCGAAGDVFSFIMKTEGVDFSEAVATLAERCNLELPNRAEGAVVPSEKNRVYEANAWAAGLFSERLNGHPSGRRVLQYLKDRGTTPETIKAFGLGYSPDAWDVLLKEAARRGGSEAVLLKAGLLVTSQTSDRRYDRFRNRLMFPIRDSRSRVIGFGARALDDSEPKYLNSPETPLFAKSRVLYGLDVAREHFRDVRQAIVVEGYMDVIMLHQHGVQRAVGVLGTALTRDHVRLLRRYVDEAVLIFDADNAGHSSASRSVDAFAAEELAVRIVSLPDGLDPDDFVRKQGRDAFLACVDGAQDGLSYKLDRALGSIPEHDVSSVATARAIDNVLATVGLMPNPVAQSIEIKRVAERSGLQEGPLRERLARMKGRAPFPRESASASPRAAPARELEKELLQVLLSHPGTVPVAREQLSPAQLHDAKIRTLVERVFQLADESANPCPEQLLARTQEEPLRQVVEALMAEDQFEGVEGGMWVRELLGALAAREHARVAEDCSARVSKRPDTDVDDRILREKLEAAREVQRARGKLDLS